MAVTYPLYGPLAPCLAAGWHLSSACLMMDTRPEWNHDPPVFPDDWGWQRGSIGENNLVSNDLMVEQERNEPP